MATLIGVREANFATKELNLNIEERILWTDSQCVLHWLKTRKPLPTFVENQIKEIQSQKDISFCYTASNQNPSDYATRGLSVVDIQECSLWWHGPDWLRSLQAQWLTWNSPELTPEILGQIQTEIKESHIIVKMTTEVKKDIFLFGIKSLASSLRKQLVFVLRYVKLKIWNKIPEKKRVNYFKNHLLKTVFCDL